MHRDARWWRHGGGIHPSILSKGEQRGQWHRCSQGGPSGPCPPKFFKNIVILCFERRFSKQKSVIRLKLNSLLPPNFWAGLRHWWWCLFIKGLGAGKFLVWQKIFVRIFPNFHERFLCNFYLQMLSLEDHEDLFRCDLQKRSSCDFLQTLGANFMRIFRDVAQIFSKSKLLCLTPHLQQAPLFFITVS